MTSEDLRFQKSSIDTGLEKYSFTAKALIPGKMQNFGLLRADTSKAVVQAIPIPELRPGYILVKTLAVALDPTDWTSLDAVGESGAIVRCDYAGIVEQVGSEGSNRFKKGDRIVGFAHGGMFRRSVQVLSIPTQ